MEKKKLYCFGEMLWDIVSNNRYPGGAPLNVAYHLAKLQSEVSLISSIGKDADGLELQGLVNSWGIKTDLIQLNSRHETGKVHAIVHDHGEVEYDIMSPVAWDHIELTPRVKESVKASNCFIYGSLSARNTRSRSTLLTLLEDVDFKVFDINLRYPHYESDTLDLLLSHADLLKLNNGELIEVNKRLGLADENEEDLLVKSLMDRYGIKQIIVTKGKDGAAFYSGNKVINQVSKEVQVQDTIGCGDAFLAAFVVSYLHHEPAEVSLKKAVAMGAFIATQKGGCPPYRMLEYENFCADY